MFIDRGVERSKILVGLNHHNIPGILMGLQPVFTTVTLKYYWGCSPSIPPIPTAQNLGKEMSQGKIKIVVIHFSQISQCHFTSDVNCKVPELKLLPRECSK